ncbi:hypothetical protein ONS95_002361 [Cadophora gregata]|uniref:uncharacterized protein n=1 Tax=Cadophora gregata TaxID=51156 RepID=UPI0026DA8A05|nr:uncharacterized protein ONS95_002361 [Cadophora gregata]KAK0109682.1 hypothetical protein ONS95_002361 [Cadophora gregata]KAK0110687.1 hypothetical protein ONS96_002289 [Cadophora gregata f. sp. sojae]
MESTAMAVPTKKTPATISSRSALRATAAAFHFKPPTPYGASTIVAGQAPSHIECRTSAATYENGFFSKAPSPRSAMPGLLQNPGARQQDRLSADSSRSKRSNTLNIFKRSADTDELKTHSTNGYTTPCQPRILGGISRFQTQEYHESADQYWRDDQIHFTPSNASFVVGMLARKHIAVRHKIGTQATVPMPSRNQLFDLYKSGELEAAQQPVVCSDNNCPCELAVQTLQQKVELQQDEIFHLEMSRSQTSKQCQHSNLHSQWEASVSRVAELESEIATAESEKKEAEARSSALQNHNDALTQQNIDLQRKLTTIEEEKEIADRRKATMEDMKRKIAESKASEKCCTSQLSALDTTPAPAFTPAKIQPSHDVLTLGTILPQRTVLQGGSLRNGELSRSATPKNASSLKIRFRALPDCGLESY